MKIRAQVFFLIVISLLFLASCNGVTPAPVTPGAVVDTEVPEGGPSPTSFLPPTVAEPTPTPIPVPLALTVNGEPVTLDEFNLALQQFHIGVPDAPSEEAHERVLGDFIDQILLAQAAFADGFSLSDAEWQARLASLTEDAGGQDALNAWLEANLYTAELFEKDLRRAIAAAWERDRVLATAPTSAEQVQALQIRVTTREVAESILLDLSAGTPFALIAENYDPEGLGSLGWFPRGFLFEQAIEEAAFSLSVGDYSGVIETSVGFHIVQVTDYAEDRPLDPEAKRTLAQNTLDGWLAARTNEFRDPDFCPMTKD